VEVESEPHYGIDMAHTQGVQKTHKAAVALDGAAASHATNRLTKPERERLLDKLDEIIARLPTRPQAEADEELAEIRRARRRGGRASG